MTTPEFEPAPSMIESMHLAGQEEVRFCMTALAEVMMLYPDRIPAEELYSLQDRLLDRYNDLNMEQPE